MYILALILMLKIYQTRHPDINASAHSAYMVMAVVILAGVTGVVREVGAFSSFPMPFNPIGSVGSMPSSSPSLELGCFNGTSHLAGC